MGLGPLMPIYQARFMRYLDDRGVSQAHDRKVWAFLGDGESRHRRLSKARAQIAARIPR
jgi:pyruvate dehydrogenase complex dehydrogenase (E1) component